MNKKGRVVIILLILLAAASIAVSGIIYMSLEKEKNQRVSLSEKISEIKSEKLKLEKKIEEYKAELSKAQDRLTQSEKKIKELTFSLDAERQRIQEAISQASSLRQELNTTKSAKTDLEKKISQKEEEVGSFKTQITKLKQAKQELENKLKSIASGFDVELGKIVIMPEVMTPGTEIPAGKGISAKSLEGKVLVVNKEYAFVVINLGKRDGVSSGDIFSIYQKNKYMGDIIVEKVDERMSSANFADSKLKDIVRENDKVVTKSL